MEVCDWRDVPADTVLSLYAAEMTRWRRHLAWDTADQWSIVDRGRRAGTVPGLVAWSATGAVAGWCFFLVHGRALQVGAFTATSRPATDALLAAMATHPDAARAHRRLWFGYFDAPGLAERLAGHGGLVARYRYLARPLVTADAHVTPPPAVRGWRASDASQLPGLLAAAYAGPDEARPFAPSGTPGEWHDYAWQLLTSGGCGVFESTWSAASGARFGTLDGAAIVTRLSPATAHVAQLAVRPAAQGQGLARALLATVLAQTYAAGCEAVTLLVRDSNRRATRLYAEAGFTERAAFLSAMDAADQPRTSTSEALATRGVSTRR